MKVIKFAFVLSAAFCCACFFSCKKGDHKPQTTDTITTYTVSTLAGTGQQGFVNGIGTAASFNLSTGVIADKSGDIFVADDLNSVIRKITPDGTVSTFAGSGHTGYDDGQGTLASFDDPSGITIADNGNIFIADPVGAVIRMITPGGYVSTIAGGILNSAQDGTGPNAGFNIPKGITITAGGDIYVADTFNHLIRKVTLTGVVTTFAGTGLPGHADGLTTQASFNFPSAIVSDPSGNLYIADAGNNLVRKITPDGAVSTLAGSGLAGNTDGKGAAASFKYPQGITIDAKNNLYVSDGDNNLIRKITQTGAVTTVAGSGNSGHDDGTGRAATFNYPLGLCMDAAGNIYVADDNYRIPKITIATRVVTSL